MSTSLHQPVLSKEVIKLLQPQAGEFFIDGTFGGGGHSQLIWGDIRPNGRLLVIDWNAEAVRRCPKPFRCVVDNFANIPTIIKDLNYPKADGLLLDLGFSSDELATSGRGFSFQKDEPLLMTYNDDLTPVAEIIGRLSEAELATIIKNYSNERFARRIAQSIKQRARRRPLITTLELVEAIEAAVPRSYERGRLHPATRTFMAFRIYANHELENLDSVLKNLPEIIAPGGRVAIISFHSLEDRLVKEHFRRLTKDGLAELLVKKPIVPTHEEIKVNPRARSAKLRALKFLK